MPILIAALAVLATLCVLNLLLTFGIVRRLRQMKDEELGDLTLGVGSALPDFTAVTTTGNRVSSSTVGRGAVVAFFSPDCGACRRQLPRFTEIAQRNAGRAGMDFLAVVRGNEEDTAEQVAALEPVAQVIVEEDGGPVGTAFNITGYPVFALIDPDGRVTATSIAVERLPLSTAPAGSAVS